MKRYDLPKIFLKNTHKVEQTNTKYTGLKFRKIRYSVFSFKYSIFRHQKAAVDAKKLFFMNNAFLLSHSLAWLQSLYGRQFFVIQMTHVWRGCEVILTCISVLLRLRALLILKKQYFPSDQAKQFVSFLSVFPLSTSRKDKERM